MVQMVCLPLPFFATTLFHRFYDKEESLLLHIGEFVVVDE
jgi:hypothetical protein